MIGFTSEPVTGIKSESPTTFIGISNVVADFDLVSFFDLIDHKTLRQVLRIRVKNGYLLDLLIRCLEEWTAGGSGIYQKGHGIPQGPEASALLAEVLLADFDAQTYPDVRYVRYVDDVKLLGKTFFGSGPRSS